MPWHDVSVALQGSIIKDYLTHFIAYWNHARETNKESEVLCEQIAIKDEQGLPCAVAINKDDLPEGVANLVGALQAFCDRIVFEEHI